MDNALAKNSVQTYVQEREIRKAAEAENRFKTQEELEKEIRELRKAMEKAAKELNFIQAAHYRDTIAELKTQIKA